MGRGFFPLFFLLKKEGKTCYNGVVKGFKTALTNSVESLGEYYENERVFKK